MDIVHISDLDMADIDMSDSNILEPDVSVSDLAYIIFVQAAGIR